MRAGTVSGSGGDSAATAAAAAAAAAAIELAVGARATSVRVKVEPFTEQPEYRSFSQQQELRMVLGEGGLREREKAIST